MREKLKFIFIDAYSNRNIYVKDYPQTIILDNTEFKFLCCTIPELRPFLSAYHFLEVFNLYNNFFKVNDIGKTCYLINKTNQRGNL